MKTLLGATTLVAALTMAMPVQAGKKNNTLTIALSEPIDGVAEFFGSSDESQVHSRAVYDRLLAVDNEKSRILPLLATSWKQIDATTWELALRDDVKFHDGSKFDADDVVYTLNWASDPAVKLRLKNRYSWISKAEKLSPTQVRIKTVEPYATALLTLAISIPMVPSDYHGSFEKKEDFEYKPIGTGSYRAVSVDRNAGIVLEANSNYTQANSAQPRPTVGKVVIKSIPDEQTRIAQMLTDAVDLTRVVTTDIGTQMKTDKRFSVTPVNGLQYFYLYLDAADRSGVGFLKNAKVRQAIAHAIDRDAIRKEIIPGGTDAYAMEALCIPFQIGCSSSVPLPAYDPAKAKALMKEAGFENGFNLELTALDRSRPAAEAISGYLSKIGIRATIKTITFTAYTKLQADGKFQGLVHIYGSGGVPDTGQIVNFHFNNKIRDYANNARINEIGDTIQSLFDEGKRNTLIQEAMDINNREAYVFPLSGAPQAFLHNSEFLLPSTTLNGYGITLNAVKWK